MKPRCAIALVLVLLNACSASHPPEGSVDVGRVDAGPADAGAACHDLSPLGAPVVTPERAIGDPPGAGTEPLERGLYELRGMRVYGDAPAELLAPLRLVMSIYLPPGSHEHFDIARVREGSSEIERETLFSRLSAGSGSPYWSVCPYTGAGEIAPPTFDYDREARVLMLRLPSESGTYTQELVLQLVDPSS